MLTLKATDDFQRVRREGRSWSHPLFVLIASPNGRPHVRIGIAAGKSVGNAVARNRAKRRLRAAIRAAGAQLRPGWDIVLIARPPLVAAPWPHITEALHSLLRRAALLQSETS